MNADPENGAVDGAPRGRRRARERVTPPVSRHGDHCFCEVGPGMLRADAVTGPQGLTGTRHGGSYRQETKPGADGREKREPLPARRRRRGSELRQMSALRGQRRLRSVASWSKNRGPDVLGDRHGQAYFEFSAGNHPWCPFLPDALRVLQAGAGGYEPQRTVLGIHHDAPRG